MAQRKCTKCGAPLSKKNSVRRGGMRGDQIRSQCKKCVYELDGARKKERRASGDRRTYFLLRDTKIADRRANRTHDLDREFLENILKNPCSYCQSTNIQMTVDRKDNKIGHVKFNVISCCTRCNYIRGEMPYEAWLMLIPGLVQASRENKFGDWTGPGRRIKEAVAEKADAS